MQASGEWGMDKGPATTPASDSRFVSYRQWAARSQGSPSKFNPLVTAVPLL